MCPLTELNEPYPTLYRIELDIDLENFTYKGHVQIEVNNPTNTDKIIINSVGLKYEKISYIGETPERPLKHEINEEKQEIEITLPDSSMNQVLLEFKYIGEISKTLLGFYRSHFELDGKTKYMAVTQFEEREARKAFPCFDHPRFKCPYEISFIIDEKLVGISNNIAEKQEKLGNGRKKVKFRKTVPMCSYTVFFGIGDLEYIEDAYSAPIIRVYGPPKTQRYMRFALDIARKSMDFGERYTDVRYPMAKCDHIAVKDFAFGAMENYGAVTYRENYVYLFPGKVSRMDIFRQASVIAHETIHMWFGNLVSPADWKYLWLNESFATYFTYAIPEYYFKEWKSWDVFMYQEWSQGIERDSYPSTQAIELKGDEEINIDISVAPIIYNKGGAFLVMLVDFLGETMFRKGIHRFLTTYQYKTATTEEYWQEIEEATKKSDEETENQNPIEDKTEEQPKLIDIDLGRENSDDTKTDNNQNGDNEVAGNNNNNNQGLPVKDFADSWVHQPGFPIVKVEKQNNKLKLSQERFLYLPTTNDVSSQKWLIPLTINLWIGSSFDNLTTKKMKILMNEKELELDLPENVFAYKFNWGQRGFYRVAYPNDNINSLGELIKKGLIQGRDIYGIFNDLNALLKQGTISLRQYLDTVKIATDGINSELAGMEILNTLTGYLSLFSNREDEIKEVGAQLCKRLIGIYGLEPKKDDGNEAILIGSFYEVLLWASYKMGVIKAKDLALKYYNEWKKEPTNAIVPADIMRSVAKIMILEDDSALQFIIDRLIDPQTPQTQKMSLLIALGQFPQTNKFDEVIEFITTKVELGNRFIAFTTLGRNKKQTDKLWSWIKEHKEELPKLISPALVDRILAAFIPIAGLKYYDEIKNFSKEYSEKFPYTKGGLRLSLELLDLNKLLIEREN